MWPGWEGSELSLSVMKLPMKHESLAAIVPAMGAESGCLNLAKAADRRGGAGKGGGWWYIGGTRGGEEAFGSLFAGG
jgi:hypothetical protein